VRAFSCCSLWDQTGGAWPFLVGGSTCLVHSDNERDLLLLISRRASASMLPLCFGRALRGVRSGRDVDGRWARGRKAILAFSNHFPRTSQGVRGGWWTGVGSAVDRFPASTGVGSGFGWCSCNFLEGLCESNTRERKAITGLSCPSMSSAARVLQWAAQRAMCVLASQLGSVGATLRGWALAGN